MASVLSRPNATTPTGLSNSRRTSPPSIRPVSVSTTRQAGVRIKRRTVVTPTATKTCGPSRPPRPRRVRPARRNCWTSGSTRASTTTPIITMCSRLCCPSNNFPPSPCLSTRPKTACTPPSSNNPRDDSPVPSPMLILTSIRLKASLISTSCDDLHLISCHEKYIIILNTPLLCSLSHHTGHCHC